ncbi:MAG: hypothetical protein ACR650_09655 [Methylocystis sp.]
MAAPQFLHDTLDEIFNETDALVIAGAKQIDAHTAAIRTFGPRDMPKFHAALVAELAKQAARMPGCSPKLSGILHGTGQLIDAELGADEDAHARH